MSCDFPWRITRIETIVVGCLATGRRGRGGGVRGTDGKTSFRQSLSVKHKTRDWFQLEFMKTKLICPNGLGSVERRGYSVHP